MSKVLVDTNLLIYALDKSSKYYKKAAGILEDKEKELFIATKNVSEYFAVCSKLHIEHDKAHSFFEDVILNTSVLYPNPVSLGHFQSLLLKYQPKGNRVYDVEIVSVMMSYEIRMIATFNEDDFKGIEEVEIIAI